MAMFLGAHALLWGGFWWLDDNYARLVARIGGRLDNLPLSSRGPLLLADWIVTNWPAFLIGTLLLGWVYALAATPPTDRKAKPGVLLLCWLPLLFGYGLLLWMIVAQRAPINMLRSVMGGSSVEQPASPSTTTP